MLLRDRRTDHSQPLGVHSHSRPDQLRRLAHAGLVGQQGARAAMANATPADLLKLKEAEHAFKIEMKKLELRPEELEVEDRASARAMHVATKDGLLPWLAVLVVGTFCAVTALVLLGTLKVEEVVGCRRSAQGPGGQPQARLSTDSPTVDSVPCAKYLRQKANSEFGAKANCGRQCARRSRPGRRPSAATAASRVLDARRRANGEVVKVLVLNG